MADVREIANILPLHTPDIIIVVLQTNILLQIDVIIIIVQGNLIGDLLTSGSGCGGGSIVIIIMIIILGPS